ncbi:MFS transporter [Actinomadura sediminis]|uniref:MFS transporter n=1 Tax=Actinomadura sediminis TaxID=1038904 RepID=A0ABW3EU85_9ACTN
MRAYWSADFIKLWAASAVSNVGDGVTAVAGPLLTATLTRDPVLVAGAAFVQTLPWLLFSLVSGALVDRVDRQRLILVVDLLRGGVLAGLAVLVAADSVGIPLLYVVFFLLGTGETLADTAAVARLPSVVPARHLPSANALFMATFTVGNQFLAKPLGAALFGLAAAVPFAFDAATFVVAAALVARMRPAPVEPRERNLRAEIAEGVRFLWSHRLLRTLAVSMGLANLAFCSAFSVFVLYAQEQLGLSEAGYGWLLTTFGVGGLAGASMARALRKRVGTAALLRGGLVVEALTHAGLALTERAWVAAIVLVVFGVHTMVWGAIAATVRQRATPDRLMGRVGSAHALLDAAGAGGGMVMGGLIAGAFGLTAPFWVAAVATGAVVVAVWRGLR